MQGLIRKLPITNQPAHVEQRERLFSAADASGNRLLTLAEVHQSLQSLFGVDANVRALTPAIHCAFHAAKLSAFDPMHAAPAQGSIGGPPAGKDGVSEENFHPMLVYLSKYIEILIGLERIDTSDNRRVDLQEFKEALSLLASWGVRVADPEEEFKKVDLDGSGSLSFVEFAAWALRTGLNVMGKGLITGAASRLGAGLAVRHAARMPTPSMATPRGANRTSRPSSPHCADPLGTRTTSAGGARRWRPHPPQLKVGEVAMARGGGLIPMRRGGLIPMLKLTARTSLLQAILRLPSGRTEEERRARQQLFAMMDGEGRGTLTIDDVNAGLIGILQRHGGQQAAQEAIEAFTVPQGSCFHAYVAPQDGGMSGSRESPRSASTNERSRILVEAAFRKATAFTPQQGRFLNTANFRQFLLNLKWYGARPQTVAGPRVIHELITPRGVRAPPQSAPPEPPPYMQVPAALHLHGSSVYRALAEGRRASTPLS